MAGMNCWEYINCGSQQKCPAFPDNGRECWSVTGTLCRGEVQGTAEEKRRDCITLCKFLEGVMGGKI